MRQSPTPPLHWPFLLSLLIALGLIEAMLLLGLAEFAYARLGLSAGTFGLLLLASIAGSAFDIPLRRLPPAPRRSLRRVSAFGVDYVVPVVEESPGVEIAVNLGGALIPAGLAIYLLIETGVWWHALAATLAVMVIVHRFAKVVPGLGVAVPGLVPPLIAGATALLLGGAHVATVAYIAGTLGTLIGADLLNLGNLSRLGGGVASIGGAGTFDGVFLSGLGAVLVAALA